MFYGCPMMNGSDWSWGFLMMLFWAIIIIVLIVVVVRFLKSHDMHNTYSGHKVDPLDLAKERYAKGDITKEQFDQLKNDLADR